MKALLATLAVIVTAAACSGGGGGATPSPTQTGTATATPTPTHTATPTPTPAPLACSPVGSWTVTDTWAGGTCGITGGLSDPFTVTSNGAGYSLGGDAAAVYNSGAGCVVTSTAQLTALSSMGTVVAGDSMSFYRHFTLVGTTVGGGGKTVDTTHSCTQAFTAAGTGP